MARPFAYNPDGNIDGTLQIGDLTIGIPTAGFTAYPSIKFWNGTEEYPGAIIICYPDLEGGHTGADGTTAYIGFKMFTNPVAFMIFVEQELGTTPTDPEHAAALLNDAGVWTNYGEGVHRAYLLVMIQAYTLHIT